MSDLSLNVTSRKRSLKIALGVFLGNVVGAGPLFFYTSPLFFAALTAEFGWQRSTFGLAMLLWGLSSAFANPFFGRLADTYGLRKVMIPSVILMSIGMMALALTNGSIITLSLGLIFAGIFACVQAPQLYSKVCVAWFSRNRGLALGVAVGGGIGLGAAILPFLTSYLITNFGWRSAYIVLGLIALVIALPSLAFLVEEPSAAPKTTTSSGELYGFTSQEARKTLDFWLLCSAITLGGLAISGLLVHSVALLRDRGVSPTVAVSLLGAIGIAQIAGRFLSGMLQDRFNSPRAAIPFFLAPIFGLLLVDFGPNTQSDLILAGILLGIGFGAETEVGAYMCSRLFGVRAFGELYGTVMALFSIAVGLGPYFMGAVYDATGTYRGALIVLEIALLAAAIIISLIGAYRFETAGSQKASISRASAAAASQ